MIKWLILCVYLFWGCSSENPKTENIRKPAVAGMWYKSDKQELQTVLNQFLSQVKEQKIGERIYGLIVPHAGYEFSGQTAAYAFKQLPAQKFETVIILGPYHGPKRHNVPPVSFKGASVWRSGAYKTPLGLVEIETTVTNHLISYGDKIKYIPDAHIDEHSIEAEIPFLQAVLKEFKIVPIVMIAQSLETCEILADAIVGAIHELPLQNVLLVASSDLYHGYSYEECKKSVDETKNLLSQYNVNGFYDAFINRNAACGGGPIIVAMLACKKLGATQIIPMYTTNSGDVTGDRTGWLVGYGSFIITGGEMGEWSAPLAWEPLDEGAQKELLRMTRKTIETYVKTRKVPEFEPTLPVLREKRGVFVTLRTKDGALRGCIGHHEADTPLYKLVPQMAIAAATQDYRFPPVSERELKALKIKLSVYLCEVHPIKDISEYEPGVHGIIMSKGMHGATFLPEVPVEEGWTREETFVHLCLKAGLPANAWREGAEFYVYKTQVFGEE